MPPGPRIWVQLTRDASTLSIVGEADLSCLGQLRDVVDAAPGLTAAEMLLVDLTRTTFADVAVLTAISRLVPRARPGGTHMVVLTVPGPVARALRTTGLDRVLDVVSNMATILPPGSQGAKVRRPG